VRKVERKKLLPKLKAIYRETETGSLAEALTELIVREKLVDGAEFEYDVIYEVCEVIEKLFGDIIKKELRG